MTTEAGWYPDPSGMAAQRFWDGQQWTQATALVVAPLVVAVPAARSSFTTRHPWLTGFAVLWIVIMAMQFWWLAPLLIIGVLAAAAFRYACRRAYRRDRDNAELSEEADYENRLHMQGDSRGMYGNYPPANY